MPTIITVAESRVLQARLEKALTAEFGLGICVVTQGLRHPGRVVIKIEITPTGAEGREEIARLNWDLVTRVNPFGLRPEDFGRRFAQRGRVFEIIGINPAKPRFAVQVMRDDGVAFGFPHDAVLQLLTKSPPGAHRRPTLQIAAPTEERPPLRRRMPVPNE